MTVLVKERHSGVSHYNPDTGRFLSEDPIGFYGEDLNLYRYVRNNPLNSVDPSGNNPVAAIALIGIEQAISALLGAIVVAQTLDELERKRRQEIAELERLTVDAANEACGRLSGEERKRCLAERNKRYRRDRERIDQKFEDAKNDLSNNPNKCTLE